MGARILKQPNGLYTRWSYVTDCPTHYNMTKEDYYNYRLELAKKEIEKDIAEIFDSNEYIHSAKDFDDFMRDDQTIVSNMTRAEFTSYLKEIGSTLSPDDFYFTLEHQDDPFNEDKYWEEKLSYTR